MNGEPTVLRIAGSSLSAMTWGQGPAEVVMLHDGLGSLSQWRSVPGDVHTATGLTVLAYERAGHGTSTPVPSGAWPPNWLHREATMLAEVLDHAATNRPLLVGHSDGASIALIHACTAGEAIRGVLALAPHSWVEKVCRTSILGMRQARDRMVAGLSSHHAAPAELFDAWSGVWVSPEFATWDIRPTLRQISVPTVIAQGADDAYASLDHPRLTAEAVGAAGEWVILDEMGHILHHDDPARVVELVAQVVASTS